MPRTRSTASMEAKAAAASSPTKRSKKETTTSSQKPKKKVVKPRQPVKQRSRKTSKKQEKEAKPAGSEKAMPSQENFLEKVDIFFIKHIQELTCGREHLRIFVPLCGNSADMLWLANQGHSVVGIELIAKWIKSFFKKSEMKYTVTSEEIVSKKKTNVYRAEDKDIVIYQCSIFDYDLSIAGGHFDGIWDQSAMPVINEMGEEKLQQYANLLRSLLAPDGRHVVEVCKHGSNFVTTERLKQLYGETSDVRYLGTRLWKYEEDEDDGGCEDEEEDVSHGHAGNDHEQHRHESHAKHDDKEHSHGSHHDDHSYAGHHHGDHTHGDHHHDDHDEQSEDTEMFYHVISFKDTPVQA